MPGDESKEQSKTYGGLFIWRIPRSLAPSDAEESGTIRRNG